MDVALPGSCANDTFRAHALVAIRGGSKERRADWKPAATSSAGRSSQRSGRPIRYNRKRLLAAHLGPFNADSNIFWRHFFKIELLIIPPLLKSCCFSIYKISCRLDCKRRLGCAASLLTSWPPRPPIILPQSHRSSIRNGPHRKQILRSDRRTKDGDI